MPPRRERADPITLSEIEQRLAAIEARLARYEDGPHAACPSPVLTQRVANLEQWQQRQNGTLQKIEAQLETSRADRQKQIDGLQKQVSDNHTATIALLAARDRQMFVLMVTALASLTVSVVMAVITFGIKAVGGP